MKSLDKPLTENELLNILSYTTNAQAIYITENLLIQTVNKTMLGLWSKDTSVLGERLADVFPEAEPFCLIVWKSGLETTIKNNPRSVRIDGQLQIAYFDDSYLPFKNEQGETYAILHSVIDVTSNQKLFQANEKLIEINKQVYETKESLRKSIYKQERSEAGFRRMVDQAPVAICILTGKDLVIEAANALMLKIWGRSGAVINMPALEAMPELHDQVFIPLLTQVYSTGIPYMGYEVKGAFGGQGELKDIYVDFIFEPLKDSDGVITSIMVVATDITTQVLARSEFKKTLEHLRLSIQAADIATWSVDLKTGEQNFDLRNNQLYGFLVEEEITGDQYLNQISEEFKDQMKQLLEKVLKDGGVFDITYSTIGFHDGKVRWIRTLAGTILDQNGVPSYFSGVSIETTRQKQDELRKSQFISIVSHELKTPLTTVKGYVQLVMQKAFKMEDHFITSALSKADKRIDKMTTIINGFLNVSQLESGKIHLTSQTFVLETLIKEVVEEANVYRKGKNILFFPVNKTNVVADRAKIEQVISNLLSNADKYSPAGSNIDIDCDHDNEFVTVKVRNYGPCINQEDQTRIFERYYRVESPENKVISGFGIGLYLCKEILDRHKGMLWVECQPDKGPTFMFKLPLN